LNGVTRCIVGYAGGNMLHPTYSDMKDHTESVLIEFDKNLIDYETVLHKWKEISTPYPTKLQYRTAIFFLNKQQEEVARQVAGNMEHVDIEQATKFWMAESHHQNFLARL
jgi:peptide-methionine (S)-S-oxide reductase